MHDFAETVRLVSGKAILIANRGISARRVCRSIQDRFGAISVMTVTDVDKSSPATLSAQELILLGQDPRAYLDIDLIIRHAKKRGVIAIHPGWGFASEDDRFPAKCKEADIIYIGSTAEAMNLLGNKVQVRALAKRLGIPVVPGSEGSVDIPGAREACAKIGFPVMLKAEGGGGGRGIFLINNQTELDGAFSKASTMAQASFGNPRLYVEKYLPSIRHIEIQVAADKYGNIFAFDERDCTVQRNHQKLIEITPSPSELITPELREQLKTYSREIIRAARYDSLATVEFLVTPEGNAYLIEANTRLQVEHGITECRYGIDLVEEQIHIAFGGKLRLNDQEHLPSQHAVQVRINCEDPKNGFTPNCGVITHYISPGGPGVRLDSNLSSGYDFPPNYDSAGALLIAYGSSWQKVLGILKRALGEYSIGGVKTTIPFYKQVIKHPKFRSAEFDTMFINNTPELMCYTDLEPESHRLGRLIAEISARGYNPYVLLGEYRSRCTPTVGDFSPVLPPIPTKISKQASPYPRGDRDALLDSIRDSDWIHFADTTPRDQTQSDGGNRFRLAEDMLIGPYLDNCNYFSIENGGGAHFHVAMLANMTYPFTEARKWNAFAPKTLKQILIRSTNVLGYKPQPKNLMRITGEMICEEYQIIRCFDFLNHVENMLPFAELALNDKRVVFEPAVSLTWSDNFSIAHYLEVAEAILAMVARAAGISSLQASRRIILGLKDMAGACPPRFMRELVAALRKAHPALVLHYHRHYTDGLFVPTVGAAAAAGAQIIDTGLGASVRWYGQGDVLATAAYLEEELGLKTNLNKDMIRKANFVLKQIMPFYDRYTSPYFKGVDHDVVAHGMPGGATSSSQEGALKQGYIHLLPYMLKFLEGTRKIVLYHDVTPGSQITWNTAFLAVTSAYRRGGEEEVEYILNVLDQVARLSEDELPTYVREARLALYREANDAFRDLLLGKFGALPLGFPADWVYESAFGSEWQTAIRNRTDSSPLDSLEQVDFASEEQAFIKHLKRKPTEEEFVLYLNHPGDALKTIQFHSEFGDPNRIPLDIWFEGLKENKEVSFTDSKNKPHAMTILHIEEPNEQGRSIVRYILDSETWSYEVQVTEPAATQFNDGVEMADPGNPYHVGSPSKGDLWVTYVAPGDLVKKGEELFNVSIMKLENSVLAPIDGIVKRVLRHADYREDKAMVPVREGELIVELGAVPHVCGNKDCGKPLYSSDSLYCPYCGTKL